MLAQIVVSTSVNKSNAICALIRMAGGGKPRAGEERIVALLKRAIGRESLLNFLRAVADVIGSDAKAIASAKGDGVCEAWVLPHGVGVLAFFQPNQANIGDLFTKASGMIADYSLSRVIAVTTNGETIAAALRSRLSVAGIDLVSLADLRAELAKLGTKKPRR